MNAFQKKCKELFKQIDPQDQKGNKGRSLNKGLGVQLGNQQNHGHSPEIHQEGYCGNGDHGVYKIIAVHLYDGGDGAGNINVQDHTNPADAEALGHILKISVEFVQGVIGQQIRRGEKMHDVYHDQNEQGGIENGSLEGQYISKTQNHTGNRQREHADKMQQPDGGILGGQCGDAGGEIGQSGTQ